MNMSWQQLLFCDVTNDAAPTEQNIFNALVCINTLYSKGKTGDSLLDTIASISFFP